MKEGGRELGEANAFAGSKLLKGAAELWMLLFEKLLGVLEWERLTREKTADNALAALVLVVRCEHCGGPERWDQVEHVRKAARDGADERQRLAVKAVDQHSYFVLRSVAFLEPERMRERLWRDAVRRVQDLDALATDVAAGYANAAMQFAPGGAERPVSRRQMLDLDSGWQDAWLVRVLSDSRRRKIDHLVGVEINLKRAEGRKRIARRKNGASLQNCQRVSVCERFRMQMVGERVAKEDRI